MSSQNYWYVKELDICVLCGVEKERRHRVNEKPQTNLIVKEFACSEHFI
jgi:hypothetical protein